MAGKVISPHEGFQKRFVKSSLDVVFGGGQAGGGKTFASLLASAYHVEDPEYRALYVRKNLDDITAGGGMLDECKNIYDKQLISRITISDSPEVEFKSGARFVFTHMANESPNVLNERVKGWQYSGIFLDELTAYSWSTFTYLMTRNRGAAHIRPMFRATTNPKYKSWVRKFIDWYIDENGYIDPDREGVVRYFFNAGNSVDDVVWGMSKEEVYNKCKERIDRVLKDANKADPTLNISYANMIKSFTFYRGSVFENKTLLSGNPDYIGSLAAAGAKQSEMLLGGNWNIDEEDEEKIPIPESKALSIFDNDPNITENRYLTVDIAGDGDDNLVILVWYGFHIQDWMAVSSSGSTQVVAAIRRMQEKHDIGNANVIYDGVGIGNYIKGYILGARPFMGNRTPTPSGKQRYFDLKTQCADKLIEMIDNGIISVDNAAANRQYKHKLIKYQITFKEEFVKELGVLRINEMKANGKLKCINKKEMGNMLGRGRSPDILDPCIMRMWIDLDYKALDTKPYSDYQQNNSPLADDEIDIFDFLDG